MPNKGIEPTACSVRSYVAPASGSGSCLALGPFGGRYSYEYSRINASQPRQGGLVDHDISLPLAGASCDKIRYGPEVLRAIVVLLHAPLEDYLRGLMREALRKADKGTLSRIPLKGVSLTGRPERFHLGDLLPFTATSVQNVILDSIDEYLDHTAFNNTTDVAQVLSTAEISLTAVRGYFSELDRLIKRRHHIVHQGDKNVKRGLGHHTLTPIRRDEVFKWAKLVRDFVSAAQTELESSSKQ
jgi:hypothetical protein